MQTSYYDRIGNDNIKKLIHDFYLEIRQDELLLPMYKDDLEGAEERLYLFLVQYLGGPDLYNQKRGHPKLRMRHMVFPLTEEAKQNWLNNMRIALDKSAINGANKEYLWNYFEHTANFLKNR